MEIHAFERREVKKIKWSGTEREAGQRGGERRAEKIVEKSGNSIEGEKNVQG